MMRTSSAWTVLIVFAAVMAGWASSSPPALPPEVEGARSAYQRNLELGASLAGKPATAEQAAEAQRLIAEGLEKARAAAAGYSRLAEAHRLIGVLLCAAYRPVEVSSVSTDPATGAEVVATKAVLTRGNRDKAQTEEGLAELRMAVRQAPKDIGYQVDYAEALLLCGQPQTAGEQLQALWDYRKDLVGAERLRVARLLLGIAVGKEEAAQERRWLREVVKLDPGDQEAVRRLAELTPPLPPGIAWVEYEEGLATAKQEHKLLMVHFTATWCSWCRKLEAEVYSTSEVISLSREFACVQVWEEKRADLVRRFRVDGYPTILFLDASERVVHQIGGYEPAAPFLADMRQALGR